MKSLEELYSRFPRPAEFAIRQEETQAFEMQNQTTTELQIRLDGGNLRRFLPSVGMTGVCGWREDGKKQRRSRCFFPSLYNSTQCHSERSEESPCDWWHSWVFLPLLRRGLGGGESETRQGQALPLQSFLLDGMVRPLRSHPTPAPKRDVGATLAVARSRGLRRLLTPKEFNIDNPVQAQRSSGQNTPISPELRRSSTKSERDVELLRSSVWCGASYPELRFAHSGLSTSNSFGVVPETRQGQALPLQSFLTVGMVRPLRSHPTPAPKRDVGATLAVARNDRGCGSTYCEGGAEDPESSSGRNDSIVSSMDESSGGYAAAPLPSASTACHCGLDPQPPQKQGDSCLRRNDSNNNSRTNFITLQTL